MRSLTPEEARLFRLYRAPLLRAAERSGIPGLVNSTHQTIARAKRQGRNRS